MMRRPEILLSPKADLLRFFLGGAASGNGNWDLGTGTGLGGLRVGVSAVDGSGVDGLGVDGSGIDGFGTDGPGIGSSESGAISLSSLSDGSLPFEIKSSNSTSDTWTKGLVTYYIIKSIFSNIPWQDFGVQFRQRDRPESPPLVGSSWCAPAP